MSTKSASKSEGNFWIKAAVGSMVAFAIVVLVLSLMFGGSSQPSVPYASANGTGRSAQGGSASAQPATVTTAHVNYTVAVPPGGAVQMPAAGDARSDPVHIPSGFTICRDASLGRGSYLTEYRSPGGDWAPSPGVTATNTLEERYVSNTVAQTMTYRFVPLVTPAGSNC